MKNKLFILLTIAVSLTAGFLLLTKFSLAYDADNIQGFLTSTKGGTGLTVTDIFTVIGKLISGLIALVGAFFVALIIYAGITWLTSTGDSSKIEKAKKTMTYAVIGVIVILVAYNITTFVVATIKSAPAGTLFAPPSTSGGPPSGTPPTCTGQQAANSTFTCTEVANCCTKPAYWGIGTSNPIGGNTCGDNALCKESEHQTCYERAGTFTDCAAHEMCCQIYKDECATCSILNCGRSSCMPDKCHETIGANGLPACVKN